MKRLLFAAALLIGTTNPLSAQTYSWTSDARLWKVGQIVTVVVDDATSSVDRADDAAANARDFSASLDLPFSLPINEPRIATSSGRAAREQFNSSRSDRFTSHLAVQVVEVLPGGLVRLEGRRVVSVDGRDRELRISGLVQARDIDKFGFVHSSRLADARILYDGKESLLKPGILSRILNWFLP